MINKNTRNILVFFSLILVIIIPVMPFLFTNSEHSVLLGEPNLQNKISVASNNIHQEILIQGKITKFGIYFIKENEIDNDACIELNFEQNGKEVKNTILLRDIISNQINYLDVDFGKLNEGYASLTLSLRDTANDQDLYVVLCKDTKTALSPIEVNGTALDAPINLQYDFFTNNFVTVCSLFLFFLLIILVCISSYKIIKVTPNYNLQYAILSFIIILLIICIRQPAASYLGEPRSEAAYDFWQSAHDKGFLSIFKLENGLYYVSFLQRITSLIANFLSPSSKYVFVIMQMIQVIFIAWSCCLIWSKKFSLQLSNLSKMLFCIFMGTQFIMLPMYYLHFMGYWGIIFIFAFSFYNMDTMNKYTYYLALMLGAICCLSKMMYVTLIPCCIFIVIFNRKNITKRFKVWLLTIFLACSFQIIYTLTRTTVISAKTGLGSINIPSPIKLINGLIYYAVQGLNSVLLGSVHKNGLIVNFVFLFILLAIVSIFIYNLVTDRKQQIIAIGTLGVMYFSVIGLNIITSGGGFNMMSQIDWSSNILLEHPHFMFVKVIIFFLFILLIDYFTTRTKVSINVKEIIVCIFLGVLIMSNSQINEKENYVATSNLSTFPTEWQKIYPIIDKKTYYAPINVSYPYALISLTKNSYGLLFGYDNEGKWTNLVNGQSYNTVEKYNYASIGDIWNMENLGVISISTKKANAYFDSAYDLIIYNRNHQIIRRVKQKNSDNRLWIDFMLDDPIYGAYSFEFVDSKTNKKVYVCDALNIGITTLEDKEITESELSGNELSEFNSMLNKTTTNNNVVTFSLETYNDLVILGQTEIKANLENENILKFKGWAADITEKEPFTEIYAKIGDRVFKGQYGLERQDVVDALRSENARFSGFEFDIPVKSLKIMHSNEIHFILFNSDKLTKYESTLNLIN